MKSLERKEQEAYALVNPGGGAPVFRAPALPSQPPGEVRPPGGVARLERSARETRRGYEKGGVPPSEWKWEEWVGLPPWEKK